MTVRELIAHLATIDPDTEIGTGQCSSPVTPPPPHVKGYAHPTICALVDREAATAIESLARYVRPEGDYILVRSMLDEIDRGLGTLDAILSQRWHGQSWSKR